MKPTHGEFAKPLPLARHPLVEPRLRQSEAFQEIAAKERRCPLQPVRGRLIHQPFERRNVDLHGIRVEAERISLVAEQALGRLTQRATQRKDALPKAVPRSLVGGAAPEERRQLVPGMSDPGRHGQNRQQRSTLAGRKLESDAGLEGRGEASEERDPDHHGVRGVAWVRT